MNDQAWTKSARSEQFIELMGRHLEEDGLPRIAGRLMGALLLSASPRSLDELTEGLAVSKASISSNARLLDVLGVVEKVTVPGDRRDYYQISDDALRRILLRQMERSRLLLDRLDVGMAAVPDSRPELQRRLASWAEFMGRMTGRLEEELEGAQSEQR
ncbi:MAG: hypothetical protein GEU90_00795 [Gemmatimonas sp.]|nr:hypothetical protein [Gemmatimonas sp.]